MRTSGLVALKLSLMSAAQALLTTGSLYELDVASHRHPCMSRFSLESGETAAIIVIIAPEVCII